jgi:hypothetical protein
MDKWIDALLRLSGSWERGVRREGNPRFIRERMEHYGRLHAEMG